MNTPLSQEFINSTVESLMTSTPEEVLQFQAVLEVHPRGEEIAAAIASVMLEKVIGELFTMFAEECDCDGTCEVAQEASLASILGSQVTAQDLSKEIRAQVSQQELAKSIKAQVEAPAAVDLTSVIKGQVEAQNLVASIKSQVQDQLTQFIGHAVTDQIAYTLEEVVEGVLDEIVQDVIDQGLVEDSLSLAPSVVKIYEMVFATEFYQKVNELEINEIVEYKPEFTAYIMTELSIHLVEEREFELGFEVVDGAVVPSLLA